MKTEAERQAALVELCWWAEAAYCCTRGVPFRTLAPAQALILCAEEIAARGAAAGRHQGELGSFLQRVLTDLGQDLGERRTFAQWMDEVRPHLPAAIRLCPDERYAYDRGSFAELVLRAYLAQVCG